MPRPLGDDLSDLKNNIIRGWYKQSSTACMYQDPLVFKLDQFSLRAQGVEYGSRETKPRFTVPKRESCGVSLAEWGGRGEQSQFYSMQSLFEEGFHETRWL